MPIAKIKKDAKKLKGVGVKGLEKYWNKAGQQANKQGLKDNYAYRMGIYKKMTKQFKEDLIPGGVSDQVTVADIANKFGVSIARAESAIARGTKVEREHTSDINKSRDIAKDHVWETPAERGIDYYYDGLERLEKGKLFDITQTKFYPNFKNTIKEENMQKTGGDVAYQKRIDQKLKDEYGVSSIANLSPEDKKSFFNSIEKEWDSDEEKEKYNERRNELRSYILEKVHVFDIDKEDSLDLEKCMSKPKDGVINSSYPKIIRKEIDPKKRPKAIIRIMPRM